MTEHEEWLEIARGGIERNCDLGVDHSPDTIYDECYVAAFDALHDAGCPTPAQIAQEAAQCFAQP